MGYVEERLWWPIQSPQKGIILLGNLGDELPISVNFELVLKFWPTHLFSKVHLVFLLRQGNGRAQWSLVEDK